MAAEAKHFGLVLPGDTPPKAGLIKRLVLFFDGVLLPAPCDDALIHDDEVIEQFPNGMRVEWTSRVPFIRTPGYVDQVHALAEDAALLCRRGILRLLEPSCKYLDPGINWTLYHLAISNPILVKAATPDAGLSAPPIQPPDGIYAGFTTSPAGYKSRYDVSAHNPAELQGVHQQWHGIAWSRIGRAIKFIRRAAAEGASSIAVDPANAAIAGVLAGSQYGSSTNSQVDSLFALALDVVDPASLEQVLADIAWRDILDLRRAILPSSAALRRFVTNELAKFGGSSPQPSTSEFRRIFQQSLDDLRRYKDEVRKAWESLRFKMISYTGGAVGLIKLKEMQGLNILTSAKSFYDLLLALTALALVGTSALSTELQKLVAARRAVRQHPFFFVHLLEDRIKNAL